MHTEIWLRCPGILIFLLAQMWTNITTKKKRFRNIHRKEKLQTKPAAVSYLESRGISSEVTERYSITTQRDHDNILVFPFYDENNILQFVKYRKTDFNKEKDKSKEWCERDCKPILFGMNHCDPENPTLVLTEGQIDSLSCAEAGIKNAVSVPTGAKGFTWIPYCWDFLSRYSNLVHIRRFWAWGDIFIAWDAKTLPRGC